MVMIRQVGHLLILAGLLMSTTGVCAAQEHMNYQPMLASLDSHPLPQWYAGAKLGIFIHWGLYSVPGCALVVSRARLYEPGLHQEQSLCGVVPERLAHSGLAHAGLSQRALRGEFQLLRLCSHLQPRVEEV